MKIVLFFTCVLVLVLSLNHSALSDDIQTKGKVCGSPSSPCSHSKWKFQSHDLSFRLPQKLKWLNNYYSAEFYAVVLKSRKAVHAADVDSECSGYFSERERAAAQGLFPRNKVFASRFGCGSPGVSYTDVNWDYNILAVYAGETETEAKNFLKTVKAKGKFSDANIRKMKVILDYGD